MSTKFNMQSQAKKFETPEKPRFLVAVVSAHVRNSPRKHFSTSRYSGKEKTGESFVAARQAYEKYEDWRPALPRLQKRIKG
jgi:hypothetical protein